MKKFKIEYLTRATKFDANNPYQKFGLQAKQKIVWAPSKEVAEDNFIWTHKKEIINVEEMT